jgi:sugar/nucleoside kinase (ribokinase family)
VLKPLDVIVAGEIYIDLIMSGFDAWPQPGRESFASHFHREIGGGASITAAALAKLGSRPGVLAVTGPERDRWLVESLRKNGVDTSFIGIDLEEPTGLTVVASAPQDRAFLTYAGANRLFPAVLQQAACSNRLSQARHVHLAFAPALDSAAELIQAIRRNGCTVSLDVGWHEDWLRGPRALALLPAIDIFFPNQTEAQAMTGEEDAANVLAAFRRAGARTVALKLGPSGAALLCDGQTYRIGPHPASPVDTTGAGDSFDAGFLHFWLNGEPPETCLRAANICGALSAEALGGIAGVPTTERLWQELERTSCEK